VLIPFLSAATPPPLDLTVRRVLQVADGNTHVLHTFVASTGQLAVNLVIAAVILVAAYWGSRWAAALVRRAVRRLQHKSADRTLETFVSSLTRWSVIVIGLVAVLQQLGVRETSILAVLGAASLAIGLALQGALSNVAAGVMLLILRPYRVGDVVEINGRSGTVKALDLFGTFLSDADNLDVFVPNGKVFGEVIINYSTPASRRMELIFRIDYADDLEQALEVLLGCVRADKRVLAKPAPDCKVTGLTDNAVTVALHAWAPVGVYWDVRFELIKRAKLALDAADFSVPYPHQIAVEKAPKPAVRAKPKAPAAASTGKQTPISEAPSES
jgi:small conductance mechanosensitive channel